MTLRPSRSFAVIVLACLFSGIAVAVASGTSLSFDTTILLMLRAGDLATPIGPAWLQDAARDITALGGHAVIGLIAVSALSYLILIRQNRSAFWIFVCVAGAIMISTLLKLGFSRPRPDLVPHLARVYTASFPSGHSMLSASVYLVLGGMLASLEQDMRLKVFFWALAVLLTVLVGISRIYLGVHWPSDVLAGWCLGALWALMCLELSRAIKSKT